MKAEFKSATGNDWKPGLILPAEAAVTSAPSGQAEDLNAKISAQGDKVRDLKAKKAANVSCFFFHPFIIR